MSALEAFYRAIEHALTTSQWPRLQMWAQAAQSGSPPARSERDYLGPTLDDPTKEWRQFHRYGAPGIAEITTMAAMELSFARVVTGKAEPWHPALIEAYKGVHEDDVLTRLVPLLARGGVLCLDIVASLGARHGGRMKGRKQRADDAERVERWAARATELAGDPRRWAAIADEEAARDGRTLTPIERRAAAGRIRKAVTRTHT